jgi:hypothetical protein
LGLPKLDLAAGPVEDLEGMAEAMSSAPMPLMIAVLLQVPFFAWVLIDIVHRRDPLYDRIAKTAVVMRAPAVPVDDH